MHRSLLLTNNTCHYCFKNYNSTTFDCLSTCMLWLPPMIYILFVLIILLMVCFFEAINKSRRLCSKYNHVKNEAIRFKV